MRHAGTSRGRTPAVADAALAVLAARGLRGLTHRAVDEAAGLPAGSTSNHARTRLALLELTLSRLAEREGEVLTPEAPEAGADAAGTLADSLHTYLRDHRALLVARCELALESTRRPELRRVYDEAGRLFHGRAAALMRELGSAEAERHGKLLVAWCEGILFAHVAGAFHAEVPTRDWLRTGLEEFLRGTLGPREGRGAPEG